METKAPFPAPKPTSLTEQQLAWCRQHITICRYPVFEAMEAKKFTRAAS